MERRASACPGPPARPAGEAEGGEAGQEDGVGERSHVEHGRVAVVGAGPDAPQEVEEGGRAKFGVPAGGFPPGEGFGTGSGGTFSSPPS